MFALVKTCIEGTISNKDFCTAHQISQANYYYWQKKYLESQLKSGEFIPVKIQQPFLCKNEIEICYPNGVRVKLPHGSDLAMVRSFIGLL
jgi:hypothetical protein